MPDIQEGQTATNPTTGARVVYRGGSWVPVAGGSGGAPAGAGVPAGATRLADGSLISAPGPRGGAPRRLGGLSTQEQMLINQARGTAAAQTPALEDAERFGRLQAEQGSGGLMALPFARDIVGAFDPEVAEMNEITARLAPAQRQPGSGTTSDRDLALFLQAVPSAGRPEQANTAILDRARAEGGRNMLYAEFLDRYGRENGTLNGAQEAWRQYYDPPPVEADSPQARPNLEVTDAQRQALQLLNARGRDRNAPLGNRNNPRFPPPGFDPAQLPAGDWYVDTQGRLRQVSEGSGRRRQSGGSRSGGGRGGDPLGIRGS